MHLTNRKFAFLTLGKIEAETEEEKSELEAAQLQYMESIYELSLDRIEEAAADNQEVSQELQNIESLLQQAETSQQEPSFFTQLMQKINDVVNSNEDLKNKVEEDIDYYNEAYYQIRYPKLTPEQQDQYNNLVIEEAEGLMDFALALNLAYANQQGDPKVQQFLNEGLPAEEGIETEKQVNPDVEVQTNALDNKVNPTSTTQTDNSGENKQSATQGDDLNINLVASNWHFDSTDEDNDDINDQSENTNTN